MKPALALLCTLALAITGCGGDGGDGASEPRSAAAILAAALKRSDASESYRMTFEMRSDLGGERFETSGDMRSNADTTKGRGDVRYAEKGEAPMRFEMILLEDELFMRGPAVRDVLRMQDKSLAQQTLTPDQFVDLLRDEPKVEQVGTDTIRGKPTVHLRGPLDLGAVADRVGSGPVHQMYERSPEMFDRIDATVDVWIAEEGDTLERMLLDMTVDGEPGRMTMSGDLLEENVDLSDVKAPEDRLVADLGEELAKAQRGSN
jgi:hypothetical protein